MGTATIAERPARARTATILDGIVIAGAARAATAHRRHPSAGRCRASAAGTWAARLRGAVLRLGRGARP